MKFVLKVMKVLFLPLHRARAIRRDDRGQVLILTGMMVLITMVMTLTTLNTSSLLYNRVRVQNAVDAGADAMATFQTRGLNLSQHLNDVHYWANMTIMVLEGIALYGRIACLACCICPGPCCSCWQGCCQGFKYAIIGLDWAQNGLAQAILGIQEVVNYLFPIMGFLTASNIARNNGAEPLLEWIPELLGAAVEGTVGDIFGLDTGGLNDALSSVSSFLGDVPILNELFIMPVPYPAAKLEQIYDLKTGEKGSGGDFGDDKPVYPPWDTMGILVAGGYAGDIACPMAMVMTDQPNDGIGWTDVANTEGNEEGDTYYCGGPGYNTYLAGKVRHNILTKIQDIPWLNPTMGEDPMQAELTYGERGDYVFARGAEFSSDRSQFINPPLFGLASSQVDGSVLMERSSHSEFQAFGSPRLIPVHIDGDHDTPSNLLIWH